MRTYHSVRLEVSETVWVEAGVERADSIAVWERAKQVTRQLAVAVPTVDRTSLVAAGLAIAAEVVQAYVAGSYS